MADLITLLVPFLFMLAIVFGALDVSGVFKNKRVNALIALVFAFFTLTYQPAIDFINTIMPYAIMFFIVFFFVGFVVKLTRKEMGKDYPLLMIVLGLVLLFFATQSGFLISFMPGFEQQAGTILTMAAAIFIGAIFLAAYKLSSRQPG
jgi:uncharacterized membrane protein YoaK (UPF0700 family)